MRFVALAGALCLVLAGCTGKPPARYAVVEAQVGDVRDVIPATGTLKAERQVAVGAEMAGQVVEVLVEANDVVRRGQVLARVKPDQRSLDVQGAEAEAAAARGALGEARARAAQVERHLSNQRRLSESGFISPAALAQAQTEFDAARASVERTQADVARAGVRIRAARQSLSEVEIRAPIDGVVLSRGVSVGQIVSPTAETPLFVLVSGLETVLVETLVAEADIARVTPDVAVAFTVEAYPRRTFRGRIRRILRSPVEDRRFVSYPVVVEVENGDGRLLPGMTASVEFVHADARQVLRLPVETLYFIPPDYTPSLSTEMTAALRRRGMLNREAMAGAEMGALIASGRERVFVMQDGRVVSRAVKVGAQSPQYVEIVEGLRPGETVVTGPARARAASAE